MSHTQLIHATMSHRYPTRFQANKLQMAQVNQAIDHKNYLADEVSRVNTYGERLEKVINLYKYIRDTPILMESVDWLRDDVWEKLNILEELLIEKSHKLDPFNSYDGTIEFLILDAMSVIDDIRAKYW
jgi:hypothetical protein